MLDAGAEIIGKTVCEAYCFSGGSHTAASGPVRNPHDPSRAAGGSSSGSGVVVATGEADMAIGCDQGGSIRMPSSFCGIVGLKPSWGVVPYTGILGMNFTIDHAGPMTRTVADNALLLEVIAGPDGVDPRQHGARWEDYRAALGLPAKGLRIGVLKEGFGRGEADVDECVREAATRFAHLGATVSEISVPLHAVAGGITFAAMQGMIASMFHLDGACLEHQLDVDPAYVAHQRAWRGCVAELPLNLQVILVSAEHLRRQHGYAVFAAAMNRVPLIRRAYDEALRGVDMLLLPTTPMKAMPLPGADASAAAVVEAAFAPVANTGVFNHTHHPAISLPCGTRAGLPVGMMLVGRHFEEATLYRAAYAFEQG
jgi:amidase